MKTLRQKGFTLYELLITTLVVGVLLSFGVPSFVTFGQNSRMAASVNDLLGSFHLARSEAARSKGNVTICASADSTEPDATCSGTFEDGWIVFQDTSGDGLRDAGEAVLRSHPPMPEQITVLTPGQGNYFAYGPTGLGRGQIAGLPAPTTSAVFCDDRGNTLAAGDNSAARVLRVLPIGRATVLRTVDQVNEQGGCP